MVMSRNGKPARIFSIGGIGLEWRAGYWCGAVENLLMSIEMFKLGRISWSVIPMTLIN